MVNETPEDKPEQTPETSAGETETTDAGTAAEGEESTAAAESAAAAEAAGGESPPETQPEPTEPQPAEPESAESAVQEPAAAGLTLGSGAPSEAEQEEAVGPQPAPVIRGKIDRFGVAMGTGRRKTAVARVRVKEGTGTLRINGKSLEEYFHTERHRALVEAPLRAADMKDQVDVWVRVNGSGPTGQAGAIVLGIARALQAMNPDLHHALSEGGYLTRDGRMVERKKYGFKKARKSFQFSKR